MHSAIQACGASPLPVLQFILCTASKHCKRLTAPSIRSGVSPHQSSQVKKSIARALYYTIGPIICCKTGTLLIYAITTAPWALCSFNVVPQVRETGSPGQSSAENASRNVVKSLGLSKLQLGQPVSFVTEAKHARAGVFKYARLLGGGVVPQLKLLDPFHHDVMLRRVANLQSDSALQIERSP